MARFILTGILIILASITSAEMPQMVSNQELMEDSDSETARSDSKLESNRKSPGLAFGLSLSGTLAPSIAGIPLITKEDNVKSWNDRAGVALISAGLIFGPGVGHLYSHNRKAFFRGVIIRTIGAGILGAGFARIAATDDDSHELGGFEVDDLGGFLVAAGSVIVLVSAIGDIARADGSARSYNRKHEQTVWSWYPSLMVDSEGAHAAFVLTF